MSQSGTAAPCEPHISLSPLTGRFTLIFMRTSAATAPLPEPSPTFAGMLADFAAPVKKFLPASEFDGLADDVATLSYEHALKTHARNRAAEAPTHSAAPIPGQAHASAAIAPHAVTDPAANPRKCTSITVRFTGEENIRLRARAAEAEMTVSAYVRSCAFEVETLRAEVKQTLSTIRSTVPVQASSPIWARIIPWRRRQTDRR